MMDFDSELDDAPESCARTSIRILSVDENPLIRAGIRALLASQSDMELIGEACNGESAVAMFTPLSPDVVLMGMQLPGHAELKAIARMRALNPSKHVVVIAANASAILARRALEAGAHGYTLQGNVRLELVNAIRTVMAGRRFVDEEAERRLAQNRLRKGLKAREVRVLELVAAGQANKQIARALSTTEGTVKNHIKKIFAKLEAVDRTHAVVIGLAHGFIEVTECDDD